MANKKRLIDVNELIAFIVRTCCDGCKNYEGARCRACGTGDALDMLEDAPTVDAVEVVRCGKCRFCKEHPTSNNVKMCTNENWNTEYYPLVHENGFCSYGERRTDG